MRQPGDIFKRQWVRTVSYGVLLGLVCQVYISTFEYGNHVVSLGTPVLNALLLFQPKLPVFPLTAVMSAAACLLRGVRGAVDGAGFGGMFLSALFYYGCYTIFLSLWFKICKSSRRVYLMLGMIGCDFLSNTIQLAFMGHSELRAVSYSAVIAVFRGVLVWILYWLYEWEHLYLRKREHQRHYAQLNQIVTDIYAESFYLQKSMEDLNILTRKSHQLYEDLEGQADLSGRALDIAREAHEIRKDYQRVVQGISALVREHAHSGMRMADIFRIIEENTRRQIGERSAQIQLDMECGTDVSIRQYYDLFAILNNLIVNSLDACGQRGHVTVRAAAAGGMLELTVADDGCGIDEDMKEYIWGPGFSTKYDEETGETSTGIGLCHVENVVRHLNGTVDVISSPGGGAEFSVRIPLAGLQGQER